MWILIYVIIYAGSSHALATGDVEFDSELSCKVAQTALHVELMTDRTVKSVCVPK